MQQKSAKHHISRDFRGLCDTSTRFHVAKPSNTTKPSPSSIQRRKFFGCFSSVAGNIEHYGCSARHNPEVLAQTSGLPQNFEQISRFHATIPKNAPKLRDCCTYLPERSFADAQDDRKSAQYNRPVFRMTGGGSGTFFRRKPGINCSHHQGKQL